MSSSTLYADEGMKTVDSTNGQDDRRAVGIVKDGDVHVLVK